MQNGRCSVDFIDRRGMTAAQLEKILGTMQVSVDDAKMHAMTEHNSVTWRSLVMR